MGLRFKAVAPKQIFVVLRTPLFVDVTPFDSYENAKFAILRYIRKNRDRYENIPAHWTEEQVWIDWLNKTGENLVIMETPIWTLEKF